MFKFEQLDIWKESVTFTRQIYQLTASFPRDGLFALRDQLRRSSASISANIAEGSGSSSKKDFAHYLDISIKSVYESVSHLYIAQDQKYISEEQRIDLSQQAELLVKRIKSFKSWLVKG